MSLLIKPIITEKATNDSELNNCYTFQVSKSANKVEIKKENKSIITDFLSNVAINNSKTIFSVTALVIFLSIIGISKLEVENSFINYFNKNTEIYKGMKLIDDKLGGTTPLEIILKFPTKVKETKDTKTTSNKVESN